MVRRLLWLVIGCLAAGIIAMMVLTPTPPKGELMIERRPVPKK